MWTSIDKNFPSRGFSTPSPIGKSQKWSPGPPMRPRSEKKPRADDLFHVVHKVPSGDSPYVKAKHVQLIDKDPNRAISLFWAAINSGDRVASALKDMAVVMKQLNRSDEAIEAIKSFRHLCPLDSQESLDNILVELYKRSGRIEEQIEMLQHKVKNIEDGMAFGGKRTKSARSQGKKIQITVEQEYSRLLGNLAWAYLQQNNFKYAEELYRKALSLEPDRNKQCNLAICLMNMNRVAEAKLLLQKIRTSSSSPSSDGQEVDDSYAKSFERAIQMLVDLETQSSTMGKPRAAQEKENYTKEFQTPVRFLTNKRNSKESSVSSAIQAESESHHVSACTSAVGKRHDNAGGLQLDEQQSCSRDQHWNSGSVLGSFKYEFPKLPSNSSKTSHQTRNSNTDYLKKGWPYKENNIYGRSYFGRKMNEESGYSSPMDTTTAAGIQESPYTQPRRGGTKWSSASKEQRKEAFWVDGAVGGCSRKLSFEQQTGTTSDENFPLQTGTSCSSGLSCLTRERRNSSRGDTRVEAYNISSLQPIVHIEVENNMSREEDDSHQYECTAENIKPVLEFQNQTESQSVSGDFEKLHDNLTCKTKKSWADMVEEDEEELLSGTVHSPETKWICPSQESSLCFQTSFNGWNNEEEFTDENMDANIMCQTPTAPIDNQIENLSLNEKSFDIKESHTSSMSPKLTLRRSMFFDEQQQKPLLQKKVLNSEGCNSPQANENEYTSATGIKSTRRKRLQVFRDLTLSSDSPRS